MGPSISFGFERLALLAVARPRIAAVIVLALLAGIFASLPMVRFEQSINRVFLSDSPISQMQRQYEASLSPPSRTILAHISAPAPFDADQMTTLRNLALDLEFGDGILGVVSPFVLRHPPDGTSPSGRPVFGVTIGPDYADGVAAFRALNTGLPTYMSRDGRALLIAATVDVEATTIDDARHWIEAELSRGLPDGLTLRMTGEDVISLAIIAGLKRDLVWLNLVGAALVALAALALLRDVPMTLLTVVPAFCGAAAVLALSAWLDYPITVLTNVIPILLLVLGGANCVHLARHMRHGSGKVDETLREIGPASALTAITTALAFASIMITKNEQVMEFAILGTLGTILAFAVSLVVFSLMALIIGGKSARPSKVGTGFAKRLARLGTAHARPVVVLAVGLLALAGYGFTQTTPWFVLEENLPRSAPVRQANAIIAEDFSGVFQMIVEVDGDWDKSRNLARALTEVAGPEAVLSEAGLAQWRGDAVTRPSHAELGAFPPALVDLLRPNETTQRIFVSMPEAMQDDAALAHYQAVYDTAISNGADRVFGLPVVMREEGVALIAELTQSLVIATLGASLFVAFAFRSYRIIPLLLIVNVLPLMLSGAALHLIAGGKLNPTAVLGLTVAFGIAIDDTIHFLGRFHRARGQGADVPGALAAATASAGQSMVLTTLLLSAGLVVTLVSGFAPIRLFGGLIIAILWAALIADLLVLPALLSLQRKGTR